MIDVDELSQWSEWRERHFVLKELFQSRVIVVHECRKLEMHRANTRKPQLLVIEPVVDVNYPDAVGALILCKPTQ